MQNLVNRFIKDESGATAIEYGLIAALVAVALIAGASALGDSLSDKFADISETLDGVDETAPAAIAGGD